MRKSYVAVESIKRNRRRKEEHNINRFYSYQIPENYKDVAFLTLLLFARKIHNIYYRK